LIAALTGGLLAVEPEYEMVTYQLVLLRRTPHDTPFGEREIQRFQEERLAYLSRLLHDDVLIIEGPVDGGPLRGVVVLDAGSIEAAEALVAEDPWVKAGMVRAEIHPWWTAKGMVKKPADLGRNARFWLGLLERPAAAPDYSEEKLSEIQAGHMENIRSMAQSGDLVLAGPMGDDGPLRGIFVFRGNDVERIVELFRQDPAHRAGRLAMTLYPWHVPAGALEPSKP
jgi:uncharacterized protein YciI